MDTLRGFVDAVWKTDPAVHNPNARDPGATWSKPDHASGDFELRRITTPENREGCRTDFFEFYWAHMMEGTQFSHLLAWAKLLLFRAPGKVPPQLRPLWYGLIGLALLIVVALVAFHRSADQIPAGWKALATIASPLLWAFVGGFVLKKVAGDAARYLHVAPGNIESRRRIREAGIKLLESLHAPNRYDRIIVVGHSLGTVIGYDVLTHYWSRCHDQFDPEKAQATGAMEALEALARDPDKIGARADEWQIAQSAYFDELRAAGHPWLVTDFVTLGSPLAHAILLMARTDEEFARKKTEREFPTCPPTLETSILAGLPAQRFTYRPKKKWLPHHAAVFAPTRWTNVYFDCQWVAWGDVIGGPIRNAFGPGVLDIPVNTRLRGGLFSHTLYWTSSPRNEPQPWIDQLRRAVRICMQPPRTPTHRAQ
jgi:hypothetical protein